MPPQASDEASDRRLKFLFMEIDQEFKSLRSENERLRNELRLYQEPAIGKPCPCCGHQPQVAASISLPRRSPPTRSHPRAELPAHRHSDPSPGRSGLDGSLYQNEFNSPAPSNTGSSRWDSPPQVISGARDVQMESTPHHGSSRLLSPPDASPVRQGSSQKQRGSASGAATHRGAPKTLHWEDSEPPSSGSVTHRGALQSPFITGSPDENANDSRGLRVNEHPVAAADRDWYERSIKAFSQAQLNIRPLPQQLTTMGAADRDWYDRSCKAIQGVFQAVSPRPAASTERSLRVPSPPPVSTAENARPPPPEQTREVSYEETVASFQRALTSSVKSLSARGTLNANASGAPPGSERPR
mmetsp:Transcript_15062/g.35504  ORF Transcript_15062/g.35504 Transcript_15062/m.35504 type:complete len:356 (-) Transcript_15062:716-1783(-)|eukprot:CAMPEP_0114555454 /NCGR_PEP_ID=MMETSP0114-20121206/8758_1 /TAXON_ID=31324 /ORGANISM="Goniomonas sp, Strain m" /LENGTH=355 /DNA_ID=CAMNT_0001740581 /DNA_START=75 /DNA_END=1142 /DNA_ORIENTATION=+